MVNFSAAKAPPKRNARTPNAISSPEAPRTLRDVREEGLNGLGQLGQGLAMMFNQYADAATIGTHFPPVAKEVANLAEQYESVAKPVDFLIQLGPFTALLASLMPLVTQIMVNHKMAPAGVMGTVPPETLTAQVQAGMMRQHAAMVREQQMAQQELAAAQAEYQTVMNGGPNDRPSVG